MQATVWTKRLWLVAVHSLLALVVVSSTRFQTLCKQAGICQKPELTQYYHFRRGALTRMAAASSDNLALVIGDSHMEGFPFERVDPFSLNAGIGGDTTVGVLARLSDYEPWSRWRYVVLAVGFNDLNHRTVEASLDNYRQILLAIPSSQKLYVIGLMPVDESADPSYLEGRNASIVAMNQLLRDLTEQHRNASYVELASALTDLSGALPANLHVGDGVHLNAEGQAVLGSVLRDAIQTGQNERTAQEPPLLPR